MQQVVFPKSLSKDLAAAIAECRHDRIFLLTDENTSRHCLPLIEHIPSLKGAERIVIGHGEEHKSAATLTEIWQYLSRKGATRHSLLINLGGGMITDIGGFAAATFKRGIDFINIPTTLLAMIDAAVGGKTGINLDGLKNEVGAFCDARFVIIDTVFLQTLDNGNLLSGYAEMIKHGLIGTRAQWAELIGCELAPPDLNMLRKMVRESVEVKRSIVEKDPQEQGLRKALNLGHTVGHAFESFAMAAGKPILHGYAVAYGLICELYLSAIKTGLPTEILRPTVSFIRENYGTMPITCNDYPALLSLMHHDKKNTSGTINFTLLANIGEIRINQTAGEDEIREALDFYREG
ncbi:MAG: 3-dehydroquinate synthase [Prevotella sp.]|uniref:3-dehydroquinate synthase n=1 Tax=Prevotella sp. TaxID=59823 RepID=UPI002A337496|nr:3-dehydroquinate synthase [Prevotella sp.]MDD7317500.1 3-dehydroquinate synthase [Prevotellaceae bacterium]MDY4019164.1 3-dehydroquinate synthase [Prevotella sp.]